MKMNFTRNWSIIRISCFAILLAACGGSLPLNAQKGKNKQKGKEQTIAVPTESVLVDTKSIQSPNSLQALPQNGAVTEEALNQQLQSKLKFIPYTRTAPVKPNVFGNYP
ncbi:MAG: hypothetical protein ACK5BM_01045, partial [Bacteroidota bacterium]